MCQKNLNTLILFRFNSIFTINIHEVIMTLSISNTTLSSQFFYPNITYPSVNLQTIKNAKGNINQITTLLNENKESCLELFRKAVQDEDSIAQIQLSQAYFEIQWREEERKNSVPIESKNFDPFFYYPRNFKLLTKTYRDAMQCKPDYQAEKKFVEKTFSNAANQGYLPAILEFTYKIWGNNTKSYGFAVQLQPFVNKGDKVIDYYFGQALKHGSKPGSKSFYEGLYWMYKSDSIPVKYPEKNESFYKFTNGYYRSREGRMYSYYGHDGFIYANEGSTILAPSKEEWEIFVKEKIETAEIAPQKSYEFEYDEKKILSLLTKNIGTVSSERFEESPTGQEMANDYERKIPGSWIQSLSLYDGGTEIGTISVRKSTSEDNKYPFEIHKTIESQPKIQPIIDLIENVMIRTGSPCSAGSWLGHLKDKQHFSQSC